MNHTTIKRVIYDQRRIMREMDIIPRTYALEPKANHIVVGMRRAGKSTLLYQRIRGLVSHGIDWHRIMYVNFEDERLAGFALPDFDDIVQTAAEMTDEQPLYYFDEIQNVAGWERFARRMADEQQSVCITGSNAEMLSSEMERHLGGRYLATEIMPYDFAEYLTACRIQHDDEALHTSLLVGKIQGSAGKYLTEGGLPESVGYLDRRSYADAVYQKVLLGDIAERHSVRNIALLRMLVRKIAETVTSEVSFSSLRKAICATGIKASVDALIDYVGYAEDAYLLFHTQNFVAKFAQRESVPRYYFGDNGILNLFLVDRAALLLENVVALSLRRRFGNEPCYLRSAKTGIDVDFYLPEQSLAVQVAYTLGAGNYKREVGSLKALSHDAHMAPERSMVITFADDERVIDEDGARIEVVPLYKFLLGGAIVG